jgi:hypothetical protein
MLEKVCRSGGAAGADAFFGECASRVGHKVVHYTFAGFDLQVRATDDVVLRKLTPFQLQEADRYVLGASKSLQKEFPCGIEYRDNLVRRSWWIVRGVGTIYAVSRLDLKKNLVTGHSGWAIQCLVDRAQEDGRRLRAYVFDQARGRWYRFHLARNIWIAIPAHRVPIPRGDYAGLGTTKLNDKGSRAIEQLFRLTNDGQSEAIQD